MNKLTSIRIKQNDGTYSDDIPVQVLADNVVWTEGSTVSLTDILGQVKYTTKGSIQHQLDTFSLDEVENARIGADDTQYQNLKARLDGEYEDLQDAIAAVAANLQTQTGARSNADTAIRSDLSSEITSRINGDNLLSGQITSEVTARQNAISSEVTARNNAINSAITTEVTNRNNAIASEASARVDAITAEAAARQSADTTLQNNINVEKARIDSIAALPSGSTSGDAELLDIRVKANGATASSAGNAVREQINEVNNDIINGLNNVKLFVPSWSHGYYDGSDGNKKGTGSNVSATFDNLLTYKKGSYIRIESGYVVDIIKYVGSTASLYKYHAVGTYYFTEDILCRMNVSKSDSSTLDYSILNTVIKIYRNNDTETSIRATKFEDFIVSNRDTNKDILWQYGYYDGSNGNLGGATAKLSVCTVNTIDVEPGDYIVVPATMNYFVHKFIGSTWQSMILQRYGTSGFSTYVFEDSMSIKIAASWNNSSTISNLDEFVSNIIICKKKYNRNPWAGKRIVWFGTSIPAGQVNGYSYPSLIGDMLGATVYNEAVGESSVRSGNFNYVTESDPNGYAGVIANVLLKSIGLSSTEKQAIFDNWNKWKNIIPNAPTSIGTDDQAYYKSLSYDVKVDKYLQGGSVGNVDAYVFDHGYNDAGADYNYASISTVPENNSEDPLYFIGAMNKLIRHILDVNPKAVIIIAGHYENTIHPAIAEAQQTIAETWSIPIIKTWEETGWSVRAVNTGWYWNNSTGKLAYSTTTHVISTKDLALRDGIHPHSDYSGAAIRKLAGIESSWFKRHEIFN